MTDFIKAPFNFVPVSDKVFLPEWADRISQDVPFSDALSGTIHLRITAETPMFIRNGSDRKDSSFSHMTGVSGKPCYFIPGSSIKGEVRSILEIMSFSKMRVDESASFAIREISNSRNKQYEIQRDSKSVHCGWLRQNPEGDKVRERVDLDPVALFLNRTVFLGSCDFSVKCVAQSGDHEKKDADKRMPLSVHADQDSERCTDQGSVSQKNGIIIKPNHFVFLFLPAR